MTLPALAARVLTVAGGSPSSSAPPCAAPRSPSPVWSPWLYRSYGASE